jgi:hypothetical protein
MFYKYHLHSLNQGPLSPNLSFWEPNMTILMGFVVFCHDSNVGGQLAPTAFLCPIFVYFRK